MSNMTNTAGRDARKHPLHTFERRKMEQKDRNSEKIKSSQKKKYDKG